MPPANFLTAKIKGRIDCLVFGDAWPTLGKETVTPWLILGYEIPWIKGGRRKTLEASHAGVFDVANGELFTRGEALLLLKG